MMFELFYDLKDLNYIIMIKQQMLDFIIDIRLKITFDFYWSQKM